jgi:hypothetical protein
VIEHDKVLAVVREAFHIGVNEGMKEHTHSKGGSIWFEVGPRLEAKLLSIDHTPEPLMRKFAMDLADRTSAEVAAALAPSTASRDEAVATLRRQLATAKDQRNAWQKVSQIAGVCMTCAMSAPEPYGCTDCLNTGWDGGKPRGFVATPTPSDAMIENSYRNAVDTEMVLAHIGVSTGDAKKDLHDVICWNVDVALDPCVSERARALQATPSDAMTDERGPLAWTISPKTEAAIKEIDGNLRSARLRASDLVAGAATSPQAVDAERERLQTAIDSLVVAALANVFSPRNNALAKGYSEQIVDILLPAMSRADLAARPSPAPAAVEALRDCVAFLKGDIFGPAQKSGIIRDAEAALQEVVRS